MEKMKKGQWGAEVDIIAAIVIVLIFVILIASLGYLGNSIYELTEEKRTLNNNLFLINLLRAKTGPATLEQIIISDFLSGEYQETKEKTNIIMEDAFGEKICWKMIINNVIIKEDDECTEMKDISIGELDAHVNLPYLEDEEIKIIEVRLQS